MTEIEASVQTSRRPPVAYEVLAVRYGTLASHKSDLYYRYSSYGEADGEASMDYYFWVLRAAGTTVLVDTGFDPAAAARRGRTCVVEPLKALDSLGVSRREVSAVVVTHLHYDHIGNLRAFPDAELIVPTRELEFWTGRYALRSQFASHVETDEVEYVRRAHSEGRVRLTEGTEEILDGVVAVEVGGHSPGQQVTVVESESGSVALASDAVHLYEELELERPFAVMHDLERMYAAYDVLKGLTKTRAAVVVPGHDPDVFLRFGGGELTDNRVAVRIA